MTADPSQSSQEEEINPLELFTPSVQKAVEGLAYLGHLTTTITLAGHKLGLQTLRPEHVYAIGAIIQPYRNTLIADKIWRNAHVAAALTHIDGNAHFCDPLGPNDLEGDLQGRLNYISNVETGWSETTLEYIWVQYQLLELKAAKAVEQLNFLSQTNQKPAFLQDLEDILKESESLAAATPMDSQFFAASNEF